MSDLPAMLCTTEAWVGTQFSNATGVFVSDIHQELYFSSALKARTHVQGVMVTKCGGEWQRLWVVCECLWDGVWWCD